MSVILRGMKMPKDCFECMVDCPVGTQRFIVIGRPRGCPLVEIPTPHGDLVDLSDMVHPNDSMRRMTIDEQLRRTCEGWSAEYVVIEAEGGTDA